MKHLTAVSMIVFLLLSCKKEINPVPQQDSIQNSFFFRKVKTQLKDSLSPSDYAMIDTDHLFKSGDAQSKNYFVRVAFQNKKIANDFLLLRTDSTGSIFQGKIIHVDESLDKGATNHSQFNGQFLIGSLDRKTVITKQVLGGRWKTILGDNVMQEEPAGEQDLPPVVVTSYSNNGSDTGDWYWYGGFFDDYSAGGAGYTYGYSGGGGSTTGTNSDNTMIIEVESNDDPPIKVGDYIKCFSTIPDAKATYEMTLYADIPVNGDPSVLLNTTTGEVGHSFIQLRKISGSTMIQQTIGFYPQTSWKSLSSFNVSGKVVDNAGHEFNSSLTTSLSSTEFQAALDKIQSLSSKDYNIETWNCTDFALSVYNAANTGELLTIPKFQIPGTDTYSNTPQALYVTMQSMKNIGNGSYGNIDIPGICGYVGNSHGSCGN